MAKTKKRPSGKTRRVAMRALPEVRNIPASPDIDPALPWFVARIKTEFRHKAEHNLTEAGFLVFVPKYERAVIIRRKRMTVTRHLFPGYAFVSPQRCALSAFHGVDGVAGLIQCDGHPALVPAAAIARVIDYLAAPVTDESQARPVIGDMVKIDGGVFEGIAVPVRSAGEDTVSGDFGSMRITVPLSRLGKAA